jgi:hypothetical protein
MPELRILLRVPPPVSLSFPRKISAPLSATWKDCTELAVVEEFLWEIRVEEAIPIAADSPMKRTMREKTRTEAFGFFIFIFLFIL